MCEHVWQIEGESPDTVMCIGVCKNCGVKKDFLNTKGIFMKLQSPKFHKRSDKWQKKIARLFPDMA